MKRILIIASGIATLVLGAYYLFSRGDSSPTATAVDAPTGSSTAAATRPAAGNGQQYRWGQQPTSSATTQAS